MEEKKRSPLLIALGVGCGCLLLVSFLACAGVVGLGAWVSYEAEAEQLSAIKEAEAYARSSPLVAAKVGEITYVTWGLTDVGVGAAIVPLTVVGALGQASVEVHLEKDDYWTGVGATVSMGGETFDEGRRVEVNPYSGGGFDWD